jgi:AP-3 complex subunit mu
MCLKFNIPGYSYSNTKIDKVDVKDTDPRTIIKKSRNIAKSGYFEIRLN